MICIGDNSFTISCDCGCDTTMIVKTMDDMVFISFSSSDFYNKQSGMRSLLNHTKQKFTEILYKIRHKEYCLSDILLGKKEKERFLKALSSIKVNSGEQKQTNSGYIKVEKEKICNDEILSIWLINKTSLKNILLGKTHRAYDICMNKEQWETFVKYCYKKLS